MMDNLKEKFTNQKFLEKLPLIGISLIVFFVIISVVITRVQISSASKELVALQKEYEQAETEQEEATKKQELTVSALSNGKKVASLETQYSKNCGDILRANHDYDESEVDITVDGLQTENTSVVESLSQYFDDDSYQDVWFPGHLMIHNPYWDFGTKYNVDIGAKEIPVVWVCYDSSIGGTMLGYTTAILNTETGKFSKAKAVVTDIDEQYSVDEESGVATVLGVLQSTGNIADDEVEKLVETEDVSDVDEMEVVGGGAAVGSEDVSLEEEGTE